MQVPHRYTSVSYTHLNYVAGISDDHNKNISFIMDKAGVWRLSQMCIRDRATSVNKQCMVLLSDKVRLATEQDFDDFHICFDGFRNNTMYCYNQGTVSYTHLLRF